MATTFPPGDVPAVADAAPAAGASAFRRALACRVPLSWLQFGVLAMLLAVLPATRRIDPDFWWHLRTGELIFEDGIPRHDVYSWTAAGHTWVAHEWLSEAIIYVVESAFGYLGNIVLFDLAMLGALALMLDLARRQHAGTRVLVLLTALSVGMLGSFFSVRPQVFSWLMFAAFVYLITRYDRGDRVQLWILPLLMLFWANLHLGYVYGFMVLALWLAALAGERLLNRSDVDLKAPALAAVACVVAALANPRGPMILWYPIDYVFTGQTDRSLVAEWQRPELTDPSTFPLLLAAAILIVVMLIKQRPRPFEILLSIAVLLLAADGVRHVPLVALVLIAVAGPALARRWRAASDASDVTTGMRLPAAALFMALTAGFIGFFASLATAGGSSILHPNDDGYPSEGAAYIREHLAGKRVFNEYHWGGYLAYRLYPDTSIFVDGRADMYGSDILNDFTTIGRVEPGWDTLLDEYGVEVVIMRRSYSLSAALHDDPRWREVFVGPIERIYVRESAVP
ncbi:MAG TPA: hypothetical protein VFH62_07110 [Dehalococcoidia bacterium]|nr:hypothetical protein [Dehalococcoidia bacterium]